MIDEVRPNAGHMNRENRPPFKHGMPGTVYRMRAWRLVRKPGTRAFFNVGWM